MNNNLSFAIKGRTTNQRLGWIESSNESFCIEPFLIHLRILFIIEYYSVNSYKGRLGVVRSKEEKIKEKICSFSLLKHAISIPMQSREKSISEKATLVIDEDEKLLHSLFSLAHWFKLSKYDHFSCWGRSCLLVNYSNWSFT